MQKKGFELTICGPVAAYGAGKMLMHLDDLQDGMMNFYRKRQLKG